MSSDSVFATLQRHFGGFRPATIFDVGANTGQSIDAFRRAFPDAAILAFEPVRKTYDVLVEKTKHMACVSTFNLALSVRAGTAIIESRGLSSCNRIVAARTGSGRFEEAKTLSGAEFCAAHDISLVDFLKIDTEGHDLDVLVGFSSMLADQRITFFEAEVSVSPLNPKHVLFSEVDSFGRAFGYRLVHISDQVLDVPFSGLPHLRRINVLYASADAVKQFRAKRM